MSLHNCEVTQVKLNTKAEAVRRKKTLPINMLKFIADAFKLVNEKFIYNVRTWPGSNRYFVAGLLPCFYATDPWYLEA